MLMRYQINIVGGAKLENKDVMWFYANQSRFETFRLIRDEDFAQKSLTL